MPRTSSLKWWHLGAGWLGLLALILAVTTAIANHASLAPAASPSRQTVRGGTAAAAAAPAAKRAVFPYSVIPGGADSVQELEHAMQTDAVVAAHYGHFDLPRTRVERLRTPRIAHVSYRIGDSILWTRKPVVLPAGEKVLTDGVHTARTRCGNQLEEDPGEVSVMEPAAVVLDTPVLTLLPMRTGELRFSLLLPPVEAPPAETPVPTHWPPTPPWVFPSDTPRENLPPKSVPEPGTMVLMLSAAAVYGVRHLKTRLHGR